MTLVLSRVGLAPDFVGYMEGWEMQKDLHARVLAGSTPSTVLLLEHTAVYTAGKRTEEHERPFDGTLVIPVDRGGKLTWHGPGQLVGYPIIALRDAARVAEYVSVLEEIIIATLLELDIEGIRIEGRSGVWLAASNSRPARKIAAIGIRVKNRVTMHGFAVNCSNDLAPFQQIVPCGISDAGVTTISEEIGRTVRPAELVSSIEAGLRKNEALLLGDGSAHGLRAPTPDGAGASGAAHDTPSEGVLL
ncbi:lipoyl(octanoyl) transferase LipB [Arthrobacter agilis]|uniref:lipoyl(octanoyl) transferase LipB n=1 Tax=Arthrobacter agilis TaxID=37921 RepID=UPI000B358A34|nr:lipoyl(octanoyl) transferase LipB [Arthrobacter agilis]OUM45413.1 lipoate--protein ligase B [Arthrobacter agilis]PPB46959.1 lipoate-protein ligase B [Arthrobacter agilis]TPV23447.1 lipoyl(octanoyl) transferase LipB [Arthrobacter agilis]VDR31833.1 Octanoyltransferase [Arthrobacter agilis]